MQNVSLETLSQFALQKLNSLDQGASFDSILDNVEASISKLDGVKSSEILLLMKYISHFKIDSGENVPDYFKINNKPPIKAEVEKTIKLLLSGSNQNENSLHEQLIDASPYGVKTTERLVEGALSDFRISYTNNLDQINSFAPEVRRLMLTPLNHTNFSIRLLNILEQLGVTYVGEILCINYRQLRRLPNVGRTTQTELMNYLKTNGLSDVFLSDWPDSKVIKNIIISNKLNVEPASIKSVEKTQGSHNLGELSKEILEVIFCKVKECHFSTRVINALANLNIVWVGEILLAENLAALGVFSRPTLRNIGAKSRIELKLFLEENDLIDTKIFDWPSLEEIKELTLSRDLKVGRKFAIEATNCDTIEDEATTILKQIMKPQHEEAMLKRFGLNDECIQWTLQEVANEGFSNGAQITRERVRQIESIYIKKLKNTFFLAEKCEGVNAYLKDLPFISNSSLQNYLRENNFTKANNGFALVCRLRNLGFLSFDHEVIDIRWINSHFLVKKNFLTYFSNFFEQIKRELTGRIFVNVDKIMDDIVPEEDRNSFLQILTNEREQFKNIVLCSDEGKWFVAKRAHRLASHGLGRNGVRTNSLVSTLTLIFSVCREVNFNFLYKGVCRDRKTRENLSQNLLREYLSYCPFLEVRGDQITCLKRPKFDGQRSRDFLIVDFMRSEGVDTMPSNRVVKFLVQQGLSSNSATVLIHTTPLVINLNSGRGPVEGLLRLICDKDSVDIISGNAVSSSVMKNLEFTIPNNPALRITGRATVPKLETEDGQYQVFDMDENHLADIMLRGNKMHGLRELAGKNTEKDLQFIFEEDHFLFK